MSRVDLHERIVGAENSSDLSESRFDTQMLRAVGASAINARLGGYAARVLSTMGRDGVHGAAEELVREAQRAHPGLTLREYLIVARGAVAHWLNPACPTCRGRKFQVMEGTPMLSDAVCTDCHGEGVRQVDVDAKYEVVFRWMGARLDFAVHEAVRAVSRKLGWGVLAH